MAKIIYTDHKGVERTADVEPGVSVMDAAIRNNIPGIDADCGGACACATCHVYVDPAWSFKVGKATEIEQSMLDYTEGVKTESRLSCQIKMTEELDGLRVTTPESQQ